MDKEQGAKRLITKLCEVMAAVEKVEKRGRNDFHNYDCAMEADILEAVRVLLAQRRVMVLTSVRSYDKEIYQSSKGNREVMVTLGTRHRFIDGDTGEEVVVDMVGSGADNPGDKAAYKALTGAMKYCITKTFLIPTGDDPETHQAQEKKQAKSRSKASKPAGEPQSNGARPGMKRLWALANRLGKNDAEVHADAGAESLHELTDAQIKELADTYQAMLNDKIRQNREVTAAAQGADYYGGG